MTTENQVTEREATTEAPTFTNGAFVARCKSPEGLKAAIIVLGIIALSIGILTYSTQSANAQVTETAKRLEFTYTDTPLQLCGVDGNIDWYILIRNLVYKQDDGSYVIKHVAYIEYSVDGLLIAKSAQTQFASDSGTNQFNVIIHCLNGAVGQGQDTNHHVGFKLVDGIPTKIHVVS